MKTSIFAGFLALFSFQILQAQNFDLHFKYIDVEQESPQPVAGVKIIVENTETHQKKEAMTAADGIARFNLPNGPLYTIYIPLEDNQTELETASFKGSGKLTINYTGYTPQYYRNQEIEDSLYLVESARREAEEARIAAENAKIPGTMLFFVINPESEYMAGVKVYDGGKEGSFLGENMYFWPGFTCGTSVAKNEKKIAVTKMPGTYSYYAVSGDGRYEWSGTYTIEGNRTLTFALEVSKAKKVE